MAINNLTLPATLAVGQLLMLNAPEAQPVPAAPVTRPATGAARPNPAIYVPKNSAPPVASVSSATVGESIQHTVAKGETLYSISRLYQVTVADLQAWNAKLDSSVKVGEVLRVQAKNSK